jgi:hypothetical protein
MEKNIPLYLGFIDIAKAYDSVDQPTLWKILHAIGILTKMLSLIKTLYIQQEQLQNQIWKYIFKSFQITGGSVTRVSSSLHIFQHFLWNCYLCNQRKASSQRNFPGV